jgi:PmbA protein
MRQEELMTTKTGLSALAASVVERALKQGATGAEVIVREEDEFSVNLRKGEVETLKESGARGVGLRVFVGQKTASTSSSDLSDEGIEQLVRGAVALARVSSEDPTAGMPEAGEMGQLKGAEDGAGLGLFFPDVYSLPTEERIRLARECERAALDADTRITNSDGAGFDAGTGHKALANSRGFVGEYRSSMCSLSAAPIATGEDGEMQRDGWWHSSRSLAGLEDAEEIGREAARRTLLRLNARRVPTQRVPIVFAPEVARTLLGHIFEAVNGDAVWRGASFLAGKLGEAIAASSLTVVNDGTLPGGFGTAPFDGEGLPTRRTVVIEAGELKSYLLNTYAAKKLGLRSTGNASRGLSGNPGIGANNLFIAAGSVSPEEILRRVGTGFYVTGLMGFGVNPVTGDYSRGATGLWIERGELSYAVQEVTIAGNLKEMLRGIVAIGNDLIFRSAVASPTLAIEGMTVAGE